MTIIIKMKSYLILEVIISIKMLKTCLMHGQLLQLVKEGKKVLNYSMGNNFNLPFVYSNLKEFYQLWNNHKKDLSQKTF